MKISLIKELYSCFGTSECSQTSFICRRCMHQERCFKRAKRLKKLSFKNYESKKKINRKVYKPFIPQINMIVEKQSNN